MASMALASRSGLTYYTTPTRRQNYLASFGETEKRRVRDADPNAGRCLISNRESTTGIQFIHCIPRHAMNNDDMVCVYKPSLFILDLEEYCSSISLNGLGT